MRLGKYKMKRIFLTLITLLFAQNFVMANDGLMVKNILKYTKLPKGTVSLSIKELETGKVIKEINSDVQISPASTQKVLTYFSSERVLGKHYNFSTSLYKTKNGDYYILLGADPYLTNKELNELISHIKLPKGSTLENLYIDDTILDNNNWGEGWQWDDCLNPLMPKFSSYNIDKNLYTIVITPTKPNSPADIFTDIFYPTAFINKTLTSLSTNNVRITKEDNDISSDALTVSGEVAKTVKIKIPVNYLRRYFILRLDDAFAENNIIYTGKYNRAKLPKNAELIAKIEHPMSNATKDILKNSNNMVAETVFKLAGGKYANNTGSHSNAMAMFNNYCQENKINCSNIRLTDGSGVSKNNLVTANFMTDFLITTANNYVYDEIKTLFATSGEGTLKNRMPMLKDKLYAKTGTLSNISGIIGYLEAKSGKIYAFAIYETDGKSTESSKKLFEEIILRELYNKY